MKKDKPKIDKELLKQSIIIVLASIGIGSVVGTIILNLFSTVLSLNLSLAIQILIGFLAGGGTLGITITSSIINSIKNNDYEEDIEYEELELEDIETLKENNIEQKTPTLKIVKGSGNNCDYKFKNEDRPPLELVNPNNNKKRR